MNGLGFWFQACINSSIACFKSGTLTKLPRRIAFSVNSLNQRSTRFSQLELVGTKWHTKARMLVQPRLHVRRFMRAVVVHHQVQLQRRGKLSVQAAQKFQPLLMPMAAVALANHLAVQYVERREQRSGAVTLVVVRHRTAAAFLKRQPRLSAI